MMQNFLHDNFIFDSSVLSLTRLPCESYQLDKRFLENGMAISQCSRHHSV